MKWTCMVTISLLLSLLPALSFSGAIEGPKLIDIGLPVDPDNDGVQDEFDVLPDGNAVLIISVDRFALDGTWDPCVMMALDRNGNGDLDTNERYEVMLINISSLEGEGYGDGELWYGIDINENRTSVSFWVSVLNGTGASNECFDLSPVNDTTNVAGEFFLLNGTEKRRSLNITSSGAGDNETCLGDAEIAFHLEVIAGPSIITADPAPTMYLSELVTVEIKEGDSLPFRIEDVHVPDNTGANISFEWYLGIFEDLSGPPSEYYCVKNSSANESDRYELHTNFGSEGLYGLYCIAFMNMERFGLQWYDMKAWGIEVLHHNTIPQPRIDVAPSEWITQLDSVSISGFRSYDRDGDDLSFMWYIDGGYMTNQTEFEHVFVKAGTHSIRLEVTDDEEITAVAWRNVTVNNIPVPEDTYRSSMLVGDMTGTIPDNYNRKMVDRRSVSTDLELPFGFGLIASFSLVSEMIVKHQGEMTFEFSDLGTNYSYNMTGSIDRFSVGFRPYLDLQLIILKDGEGRDLINGTVPLPLQDNDLGLDSDGEAFVNIPTLTKGLVDVYTWDLFREIYNGTVTEPGGLSVTLDDIEMLEVDLFSFASTALGLVLNQYAFMIGETFNLLDVFANLYMTERFDVRIDILKDIYMLIDHHGSDHNDLELCEPGQRVVPWGSLDDRDIFVMTSNSIGISMTPSLSLKFRLTDWGRTAYGTYDLFERSGIILGTVRTAFSFLTTGNAPEKDYTFDKELWEGRTALNMSGEVRSIHPGFLTYSSDHDNDGYINIEDAFPFDASAWKDTDGDGKPDELHGNSTTGLIEDEDDDNDGVPDIEDEFPHDPGRTGEEDEKPDNAGVVIIAIAAGGILFIVILFLLVWLNREDEGKSWGKDEE
ncbi:MAG: PKD domain-containing protein [Candidatus Thermoplasmatota archaeon]|nr:PKD domain-containing protein [Candidatus Thermoplasmatota archaeon]